MSSIDSRQEFIQHSYDWAFRYRDVEGRPLGEANSPAEAQLGVSFEFGTCPYAGSRRQHHKPMNLTGLRQLTEHWSDLLGGVLALRRAYLERHRAAVVDMEHLFRLLLTAVTLPAYLLNGPAKLKDGQLPAFVSAYFKSMLGLFQAAAHYLTTTAPTFGGLRAHLTAEELARYTDSAGLFESPRGVCAGPPHMITNLLRVVIDGDPVPQCGSSAALTAIVHIDDFLQYHQAAAQLFAAKWVLEVHCQRTAGELLRLLQSLSLDDDARKDRMLMPFQPGGAGAAALTQLSTVEAAPVAAALTDNLLDIAAMPDAHSLLAPLAASLSASPTSDDAMRSTLMTALAWIPSRSEREELVALIAHHAAVERAALGCCSALQARVNASAGRPCDVELSRDDLSIWDPNHPSALIEQTLGVVVPVA